MSNINTINVRLLNNSGGGFAQQHSVSAGTSMQTFFNTYVGGDSANYRITLNGEPASAETQIVPRSGMDFAQVTITPLKIEGAVDGTVNVRLLNNSGGGFAQQHSVSVGTTMQTFFNTYVGGDSANYRITLNGEPASAETSIVARPGLDFAQVTITPLKIEGA